MIKSLQDALLILEKGGDMTKDRKLEKAQEVSRHLLLIKNQLYGNNDQKLQTDITVASLAQEIYNSRILILLINNLSKIEFKAKKDVAQIFNKISGLVQMYSTVGLRAPICLLKMLLKIWATSFLASNSILLRLLMRRIRILEL